MNKIGTMIDNIPYLSELTATFHKTMLNERYEKMLLPALKKVIIWKD